jgi:hypothetical protein
MKNDASQKLKASLSKLLSDGLSEREEQELKKQGFELKKPTRTAAIAVALYKKAAAGDLSAIKELRSMLPQEESLSTEGTVKIIDDIGD